MIMTDLMQIISNGAANIKLEITGEDLRVFSDELINRAINEVALAFRVADEERLLSREEVKDMCDAMIYKERQTVIQSTLKQFGFIS